MVLSASQSPVHFHYPSHWKDGSLP